MRFLVLSGLAVSMFGAVAPAYADSTTTYTAAYGETVRSSPEAPSPQTPVVVSVTEPESPCPGCGGDFDKKFELSITFRDDHDFLSGDALFANTEAIGPRIVLTNTRDGQSFALAGMSVEVDSSLLNRGWVPPNADSPSPTFLGFPDPGGSEGEKFYYDPLPVEALPDGDLRVFPGPGEAPLVSDVLQKKFQMFAGAFYKGKSGVEVRYTATLADTRKKGFPAIFSSSNYQCSVGAKLTVTKSVAKKLGLKTTVLSEGDHDCGPTYPWPSSRMPLTKAAKKALGSVKKLQVTLKGTAIGETARQTAKFSEQITLK